MIGHLPSESDARTFGDYLYVQGIRNQIESEKDGTWVVWIQGEDEVDPARNLLKNYLTRPKDPEFGRVAKQAAELRDREKEEDEAAAKRYFNGTELFGSQGPYRLGPVTLTLIGISVLIWAGISIFSIRMISAC